MNVFQKILGAVFPPYKFSRLQKEQSELFMAIISSLSDDYKQIRIQTLSSRFWGFNDSKSYPDFKFVTLSYKGEPLSMYKKHGQNFKISGSKIFSKCNKKFEDIEILVQDNLVQGLKITNSDYQLNEFDLGQIINGNVSKSVFEFSPSETDIFYNSLSQTIKDKLNPDDLFDINFNNRDFYSFYDLEDGNYLAIDKNLKVYSLVHDARPVALVLKMSLLEILNDISENRFSKENHLEERYKNSK
jgi:hypothetical protein